MAALQIFMAADLFQPLKRFKFLRERLVQSVTANQRSTGCCWPWRRTVTIQRRPQTWPVGCLWHFLCTEILAVSQRPFIPYCLPLICVWCQRLHHKLRQNVFSVSDLTARKRKRTHTSLDRRVFLKANMKIVSLCKCSSKKLKLKLKNISKQKSINQIVLY